MYYALCYVSTANNLLNFEIKDLCQQTESDNIKKNISGVLIYNGGNFLQYIEGHEGDIKTLFYQKITNDSRHKNSIVLVEKKIENLYFDGYAAGFSSILNKKNISKLRSYLTLLKHLDSDELKAVTATIETFLGKSSNK